jgi:hypothetical protein
MISLSNLRTGLNVAGYINVSFVGLTMLRTGGAVLTWYMVDNGCNKVGTGNKYRTWGGVRLSSYLYLTKY